MAAALATIQVIQEEELAKNAHEVGNYLKEGLLELQKKYPAIGDVRGKGLMLGCEFVKEGKEPDPQIVVNLLKR